MSNAVMPTYERLDISFIKGKGVWLTSTNGEQYLDALSGIAVCNLGHAHPAVTDAISDQASNLIHTSNIYNIPLQQKLADKLTIISGMDQVFFCNSGAEANEAAIKIARKYGHSKGIDKPVIIVMDGSFHGRTMATLTATGNTKVQSEFEPLLPGFIRVPYNNFDALKISVINQSEAVAIMLEPVQGEGGVIIPDSNYLEDVRILCTQYNLLMMVDEVQTGIGRTGKWFAFQHTKGILPDVMMLAKGLGNGVPIGACLVAGKAINILREGSHASTFGGNPLACRVALTVLETMEKQELLTNVNMLNKQIMNDFKRQLINIKFVKEIRSVGFMFGIELTRPCTELVAKALDKRILINVTTDNVIRLLPPLVLNVDEANEMVKLVVKLVFDLVASIKIEIFN